MRGTSQWINGLILTAFICATSLSADARGLLGLFAEEEPAVSDEPAPPVIVNIQQPDITLEHNYAAFISNVRRVADPNAELYGFLEFGQRIDLEPQGEITLTLLNPCYEEVVIEGNITLHATGIEADPASQREGRAVSCRPLIEVLPLPSRAVAAPSVANPLFDPTVWQEIVINGNEPIFKWPGGVSGDLTVVEVYDIDQSPPVSIWKTETPFKSAIYPAQPDHALITGHPYMAVVRLADGTMLAQVFSIDQNLAYANIPLNTVVMANRPLQISAP